MQDDQQDRLIRPALSAYAETPRAICGDEEGPILVLYSGVVPKVSLQVKKEMSVSMRAVVGLSFPVERWT
jgi:hypothetical protein